MATKKTATSKAPAKTATPAAKATATATTAGAGSVTAFAPSPAPEHTRVDPESADVEHMKSLLPVGTPKPVFSTMALVHGEQAVGAQGRREGLAWNRQMDLLWALGYPEVLLIVDGFPAESGKQGHLDYWDPEQNSAKRDGDWWVDRCFRSSQPRVLGRAGAWAVLWELQNRESAFALPDAKFLEITSPGHLDPEVGKGIVAGCWHRDVVSPAALTVEALAGPDCAVEGLLVLVANPNLDEEVRWQALRSLRPVARRLTASAKALMVSRVTALTKGASANITEAAGILIDPMAYARAKIASGRLKYALSGLDWLDGHDELVLRCQLESLADKPDIPQPRYAFTGGEPSLLAEAAHFGKYEGRDVGYAYMRDYTSLKSPALLGPQLELLGAKDFRDRMMPWFKAHASDLRAELETLAESGNAKYAKLAVSLLKKL